MIEPRVLEQAGFLANLGNKHLHELAAIAEPRDYAVGSEIFHQSDRSMQLFFVLAGEVALDIQVSGQEAVEIHRAGPGEFIGWSSTLGERAMTGGARATAPTKVAVFEMSRVLEICQQDPSFGMAFYREVAQLIARRLYETRQRLSTHLPRKPLWWLSEGSD